jgi:rubrerythrin
MSSADLHERFDELIKSGKFLLGESERDVEYFAKKARWETECQHLLERAFGKDSIFLKSFQKALSHSNWEVHVPEGLSIMEGAKEELLRRKSDKLDMIEKEIKEEKAEAKRRAAVAETKQWGSVIELIDMLREELKRRTKVDQDISEIRKEIGEVSKRRVFSCSNCGNPYEAYPPDDLHDTVTLQEPSKKNAESVIKIVHDCSVCKHPITLYWYIRKPAFAFG